MTVYNIKHNSYVISHVTRMVNFFDKTIVLLSKGEDKDALNLWKQTGVKHNGVERLGWTNESFVVRMNIKAFYI